jgi:uncharacterized RDD family membrane protein YckC
MERGSTPDRPGGDEPGDADSSVQPPDTPTGPQAPTPPREPGPPPEAPGPGAPPPEPQPAPEAPGPPPEPPPQAPPAPEAPPGYGGPVPPGGWQAPVGVQQPPWAGAPLSGWWRRVGAYVLDGIFTAIVIWVGEILIVTGTEVLGAVLVLGGLVIAFFYYPVTMMREGARNGQTLGKQILGIRVVRDDGQTVTFGFALLREFVVEFLLFQVLGSLLFGIPWLINVLWPLWDSENRALHDMIVKSHVVEAQV